jgi:hypothetical protein
LWCFRISPRVTLTLDIPIAVIDIPKGGTFVSAVLSCIMLSNAVTVLGNAVAVLRFAVPVLCDAFLVLCDTVRGKYSVATISKGRRVCDKVRICRPCEKVLRMFAVVVLVSFFRLTTPVESVKYLGKV